METLGSRIKSARKSMRLTQRQMADIIGVNYTMISLYESDARVPRMELLDKIANTLNVSVDYLMGFSEFKSLDDSKSTQTKKEIAEIMQTVNEISVEEQQIVLEMLRRIVKK